MTWQTTDPYELIAAWRTGSTVQVAMAVFEDTPGEVRTVVDVRPFAGFDRAVILDNGAFMSGQRGAPQITWRVV